MEKRIRRYSFGDIVNSVMDDMGVGFDYLSPFTSNFTFRGTLVDTDKFDIVPRKSWYEEQVNRTQERIEALDRQHEADKRYYESKRKELIEEKERLLRERDNKNKTD